MSKVFVVPDIHLKLWMLEEADMIISADGYDKVVMLGDLVDDWGMEYKLDLYDEMLARTADFIVKHNAGRPVVNRFDTDKRKECVFDGLFSYNKKDAENIYGIYEGELKKLLKKAGLFPIGMEPGGDLICVDIKKDGEICMFGMENGEVEFIAESISEMMNKLY